MNKRIRHAIAQEAAKIIANSGQDDYLYAKQKAASNMGINDNSILPSNIEIESALVEYHTLFDQQHPDNLQRMRETALKAMQFFEDYQPLLVGPVVTGTANRHSEILLHLFADTAEDVGLYLDNRQIPSTICERRLQFQKKNPVYFPAYKFLAGDFEIAALVLPHSFRKQTPLDPVNGKPMRRIKSQQLDKMLDGKHGNDSVTG